MRLLAQSPCERLVCRAVRFIQRRRAIGLASHNLGNYGLRPAEGSCPTTFNGEPPHHGLEGRTKGSTIAHGARHRPFNTKDLPDMDPTEARTWSYPGHGRVLRLGWSGRPAHGCHWPGRPERLREVALIDRFGKMPWRPYRLGLGLHCLPEFPVRWKGEPRICQKGLPAPHAPSGRIRAPVSSAPSSSIPSSWKWRSIKLAPGASSSSARKFKLS